MAAWAPVGVETIVAISLTRRSSGVMPGSPPCLHASRYCGYAQSPCKIIARRGPVSSNPCQVVRERWLCMIGRRDFPGNRRRRLESGLARRVPRQSVTERVKSAVPGNEWADRHTSLRLAEFGDPAGSSARPRKRQERHSGLTRGNVGESRHGSQTAISTESAGLVKRPQGYRHPCHKPGPW